MPFFLGDEPTNTGDSVGIQCMCNKGDLPLEIRFVLNSSPIVSGENGITIVKLNQRTSSLNINSVEGIHRGIFKCVATNAAGSAEHSAELHVNGLLKQLNEFKRIFYNNNNYKKNVNSLLVYLNFRFKNNININPF